VTLVHAAPDADLRVDPSLERDVVGAEGPGVVDRDVPPLEPPAPARSPGPDGNGTSAGRSVSGAPSGRHALWSTEAEQAVLGAMLLEQGAMLKAVEIVGAAMFFREGHQLLFRAMAALAGRSDAIDPVTLRDELARRGDLDRAGGMEYIATLIDVVPTAANVAYHAQIVRDYAQRRELARLGQQLQDASGDLAGARGALERASTLLAELSADVPAEVAVHSLRQLLEDPDAAKPPAAVEPRLAYAGRVVCIAGTEGCGKTTLVGAGTARHSTGTPFLDGVAQAPGPVLWVNLEEHRADVVRRAVRFGADADRFFVLERLGDAPLATILGAITTLAPTVTVVDSINVLASLCGVVDGGQAGQWLPVLRPLEQAARQSGTAMVWIAQAKKADGSYRDSTAIGHSADVVLELPAPELGSARRRVRVKKSRLELQEFTVELVGDDFQLVSLGALSTDARVFQFIVANPKASKRAVREGIGGRADEVDGAIRRLLASGAIQNVGGTNHHNYEAAGVSTASPEQDEGDDELPF